MYKSLVPAILCFSSVTTLAQANDSALSTHSDTDDTKLEETIVLGRRMADYTVITENAEKLVTTAGTLGDPLSAIFALPGVNYSQGQEPAVRGSSPADNSFVVDFLPASYIFHEFGVSIFSEFILQDFKMYSAGFGPEYSNATGAVFDVKLRDPRNQKLGGAVDLSMLRSGVFLEGGITENTAFYVSYRKSMLDLFINEEDLDEASDDGIKVTKLPSDTDYQTKFTWNITDHHRFSVSANGASDEIEAILDEQADFVASNPDFAGDARLADSYAGKSLLWEYDGDGGSAFKLGYGLLNDKNNAYWGDNYVNEITIDQETIKAQYSLPIGDRYRIEVGGQQQKIDFNYFFDAILFVCTEFDPSCDLQRQQRVTERSQLHTKQTTQYINGTWIPWEPLTLDLGVQRQHNDYSGESFTLPRFAASLEASANTKLTLKAGSYNRFADLGTVLPETGNPNLKSPTSNHFSLGVTQEFNDGWSLSIESYYKTLDNLPRSVAESEPQSALRYVNETEGKAAGIDVMVNKNRTDKWWGWLSFSYGKSERTNVKTNETTDYVLDTPLIANWVMNYQYKPKFNIGWRWSVRSGQAYTPITGVQENPWFEGSVLPEYGEPYTDRLPLYNRLDVRMQWDVTTFGLDSAVILDIINVLNYNNISDRQLDYDKVKTVNDPIQTVDTKDIGIQPALTYRVMF